MALWPSGKAKVCNTSTPGSNPGGASQSPDYQSGLFYVLEYLDKRLNDIDVMVKGVLLFR